MDPGLRGSGGDEPDPLQHAFPVPPRTRRNGCLGRGCGLGCLFLLIIFLVSLVASMDYMLAESPILPAEAMLGKDATTFQVVTLSPQNPGVRALLSDVLESVTRRPDLRLGPYADFLHSLVPAIVQVVLPMQAVQVGRAGGQAPPSATISFGHTCVVPYVKDELEGFLLHGAAPKDTFQGCPVLAVPAGGSPLYLSCWQNNLALSPDPAEVKRNLQRLTRLQGAYTAHGKLADLYHRLNPLADLRGVVVNEDGTVKRLLRPLLEIHGGPLAGLVRPDLIDEAAAGIDSMAYEGEVISANRTDLHLVVVCRGAAFASRLHGFLDTAGERLHAANLAAPPSTVQNGATVELRLHLIAVRGMVDRALGVPPAKAPPPTPSPSAAP